MYIWITLLHIHARGSLVSGGESWFFCSLSGWGVPPSPPLLLLMSIQMLLWNQSCLGLMSWMGSIVFCIRDGAPIGWLHWVALVTILKAHFEACLGALVAGCEAAMIFQSTYGVSVTFRVTPTWVKCMFWRTSPMADRHSSLQEEKIRHYIHHSLKLFGFLYNWFKPVGCFRDNGNAIDESGNNGLWRLIGAWMVTIMGFQGQ